MKHTTYSISLLMLLMSLFSCNQRPKASTSDSTTPIENTAVADTIIVEEIAKIDYDTTILYRYVSDSIVRIFYDLYDGYLYRVIEVITYLRDNDDKGSSLQFSEEFKGAKKRYYVDSVTGNFYAVCIYHSNGHDWPWSYSVMKYNLQTGNLSDEFGLGAAIRLDKNGFTVAEARLTNEATATCTADEIWLMHDVKLDWNKDTISVSSKEYDYQTMVKRFRTPDSDDTQYVKGFYSTTNLQPIKNRMPTLTQYENYVIHDTVYSYHNYALADDTVDFVWNLDIEIPTKGKNITPQTLENIQSILSNINVDKNDERLQTWNWNNPKKQCRTKYNRNLPQSPDVQNNWLVSYVERCVSCSNGILTTKGKSRWYNGGYIIDGVSYNNYDLMKHGERINLHDVLISDYENLNKIICDTVCQRYGEPWTRNAKITDNYTFTDDGILFQYIAGDVSCRADGPVDIIIPYSIANIYIKPYWKERLNLK